jgi:hypothetical protein
MLTFSKYIHSNLQWQLDLIWFSICGTMPFRYLWGGAIGK